MFAFDIQQARALGAKQPLVAVGRQKIDAIGRYVGRKNTQALNGVKEKQAADTASDVGDLAQVDSPSSRIADPAHADDSRAAIAGGGEPLDIDDAPIHCNTA